ncbi:ATP-dependent helicase [Clostridium thermarum]|uniref:ATP-dependent helicase n=1 Tax=Clostridium thermarum TaxID=1716543 RepID=UPI00112301E5|nr:ATP-dependent helicase [Clostridium thermarum]
MQYEEVLEKLNEYQREAVLDESEACIVNANVGSGKTTVLIAKIIYLHYAKVISYEDMIVLTFTNKAANEIKERLMGSDNSVLPENLQGFGTFHSVALNLLRKKLNIEKLGYTKDFQVIEQEEEVDIALQIIRDQKLNIKYKNRLNKRLEQALLIEKEEERVSKYNDDIFRLVQLLKDEKIKQNKMTFSDLLENAITLLDASEIEPKWIIIDEVQDCDRLQLEFIDRLKKGSTRLFAVGDPNQVIYSWRGTSSHVVYFLKHRYHGRELSLPINYRSSNIILEAARPFLETGDSLRGVRESENKIIVKNHYNPFNEACYLADKIRELHGEGVPYKEIAIFYRTQNQSQVFEAVFSKEGIPYEVSLKKTTGDIPVLKWIIRLLRFSVNHSDYTSGIFVLSHKDYGERFKEAEAVKIVKGQKIGVSNLYVKMMEFTEKCSYIKDTKDLYEYFEIDKYIRPTASAYGEDKASIYKLLEIIQQYISKSFKGFMEGLRDFINSSALYGINIFQRDIDNEEDSVKLMTLHASKGLEFTYVFITGVNYGLIPLQARNEEEEEEERRLFFVGITRAKEHLELSYYTNPEFHRAMPGESRFIRMIPDHLIQKDAVKSEGVNLQELKKEIQKSIEVKKEGLREANAEAGAIESKEDLGSEKTVEAKKVCHKKYGTGIVLKEDDMMIEVEFENYGKKEFMKAFSELEFL